MSRARCSECDSPENEPHASTCSVPENERSLRGNEAKVSPPSAADDVDVVKEALLFRTAPVLKTNAEMPQDVPRHVFEALARIADRLAQRERLLVVCGDAVKWIENMRIVPGGERDRLRNRLRAELEAR